ncbi:MAG: hypothetical protein WCF16_13645 [Alphaproteobacteria bacterium]
MSEHETDYKVPIFKFSREISLGHLLQASVIAFAVVGAYFQLKAENEIQDVRLGTLEQRFERDMGEVRSTLYRIEDKLDRKADKP